MEHESTVRIAAPAAVAWALIFDVEAWPAMTPTVRSVELLDPAPLRVGSRARIAQPRQPVLEWTVTEVVDGRSFTWENRSPGVTAAGIHEVRPDGDGCVATLAIRQRGPLAGLTGLLFGRRIRRYVDMEAAGLKHLAEAATTAA